MTIQPIDERIVIKQASPETVSKGGIIIPDTSSKSQPTIGEVVAVGDDVTPSGMQRKPLSELVHIGDKIVFAKYAGTELKIDDQEFLIIPRDSILGVITG